MKTKTAKIIFWVSTSFIFLFEGVMPALFSQSERAKESMAHLGYPQYFGVMIVGFRILGVFALMIPKVPGRVKEWAYAGFTIEFIAASISHTVVEGFNFLSVLPLIILGILVASYLSYHKMNDEKTISYELSGVH